MVKGFTLPRSPLGLAAIDPPPPWHYSGDAVGVEYWADPKATAAFLPEGLSPDAESNGHAVIMFLDWQFTAQHEEHLDPARYQYREAFILIDACWGGTPVTFCPLIYVDNDAALARGWIQGFPKRLGSIFQTRTFAAQGPASPPLGPATQGFHDPISKAPFTGRSPGMPKPAQHLPHGLWHGELSRGPRLHRGPHGRIHRQGRLLVSH